MSQVLQYRVNKCIFSSLRKLSLLTLGSLKLSGSELQADGPATEKARRLYVAEELSVIINAKICRSHVTIKSFVC